MAGFGFVDSIIKYTIIYENKQEDTNSLYPYMKVEICHKVE